MTDEDQNDGRRDAGNPPAVSAAVEDPSIRWEEDMIVAEVTARIRRLYFAEHWKVGTIASQLQVHHETVKRALWGETGRRRPSRPSPVDAYVPFLEETLTQYPRLRATRLYDMIRARGYAGGVRQVRRTVAALRPRRSSREAFLSLRAFPGEQAQVDWASFGWVEVGRTRRRLSCFVMTLSYSRGLYLEFFFDQTQESFLRGHVRAFSFFGGVPRLILYDNLRAAVLERLGAAVHFHPRLMEMVAHYHFQPRPCAPARGNEKGRVERAIGYIRESFFAARPFTTLGDFNRQAWEWRDTIAHRRAWPGPERMSVETAFEAERARLLPLPEHPFDTDQIVPVLARKVISVPFDGNRYSIPPQAVGRALTIVASDTLVRILDAQREIACHRRSYERRCDVEDPAHKEALLREKRRAQGSTPCARLKNAVPEAEVLLEAAFERGESVASQTAQLLRLLDRYGAQAVHDAVREALERKTPRASSVAYLIERRRRGQRRPSPIAVDLARRPDLADITVKPHPGEIYDALSHAPKRSDS